MDIKYNLSLSELMDFFCETEHQGFSMEEIETAEKRLGILFPQSYRDFLFSYGKDKVNTHHNHLVEPKEIYSSYELLQEDLEDEWQLPVERWNTITEDYILIWYENQGVWSAGYQRRDLLTGVTNPPVYISTNDDYVTYAKCSDDTDLFLVEMLRAAAWGWNEGERFTDKAEIERVLSDTEVDLERLRAPSGNGTCSDGEHLYFYYASDDYLELLIANRTLLKPQKVDPRSYIHYNQSQSWSDRKADMVQKRLQSGPRRVTLLPFQMQDLGMRRPKPQDGIPLHPMVAWRIQKCFNREPSTAYDWGKDIARIKTLTIDTYGTRRAEDENYVYINTPSEHFPPVPYYYDLQNWSVIGRMTNLQALTISEIFIDNFSFLGNCKNLKRLYLHNTNFSDCRLLLELPNLKEVNLCFCPLEYTEVLQELSAKCSIKRL